MTTNPVWDRFCALQMESWIEWLRNIHLNSYFELGERFIHLNPYFYPESKDNEHIVPTFEKLMVNRDFLDSLSDKGILVWANSNFADFILSLKPYSRLYPEISHVINFFETHIVWFTRVYQFLRADLVMQLREEGRQI